MSIEGIGFLAGILPILLSAFVFLGSLFSLATASGKSDWGPSFLRASILWSSYAILSTELLSIFKAVSIAGLSLMWTLAALVVGSRLLGVWGSRLRLRVPKIRLVRNWLERVLLASILVIVLITGFLSWKVPPQTPDSLNYHMSRVAHWAQNRSIAHYATDVEVQNSRSPGAEFLVLQNYVLLQGDRLVNFVQWYAMLGSLIGVYVLARGLGGNRTAALIASGFAATIPMGIIQASNTMTDYVVAFWLICVAYESLMIYTRSESKGSIIFLGLAVGLSLLTKLTSASYLLPMVVIIAIHFFRRRGVASPMVAGGIIVAAVVILNAGHMARTWGTYGSPLNPAQVKVHRNEMRNARGLISNVLRNAALHASTPWSELNWQLFRGIVGVHYKLGVDPNDPRTTAHGEFGIGPPTTEENLAGNTAHAVLILLASSLVVLRWKRFGARTLALALVLITSFIVSSFLFKWQIFGSRYHLPFFVLFAPVVAITLERALPKRLGVVGCLVLVGLSWPWLVRIQTRPLIRNGSETVVGSVISEPRDNLYLPGSFAGGGPYKEITSMIKDAACGQVGLRLSGAATEYPFWVFLGAPRADLKIAWIVSDTPSAKYMELDFDPCAVICQTCPADEIRTRGLPAVYDRAGLRLFLQQP